MSQPETTIKQRYVTVKQAAIYLGRSYYSTLQFIKGGGIPVIQEGRKLWLDLRDVDEYMSRIKTILE